MERMISINPPGRQQVIVQDGSSLERRFVYMESKSWDALQRLCARSKISGSRVIAQLIAIADQSTPRNQ